MADFERVARTYYGLTALWTLSASLIWGINTLFMLDAGLSIFRVFAANAAFTAAQVLFEIPTGVVADTRGRRLSFLLAAFVVALGTVAYIWLGRTPEAAYIWWLLASVLLGLGFTFFSGAVEAWFVDAFHAAGGDGELDSYFARGAQVFSGAMLIGTVLGGVLGMIAIEVPYIVRGILLGILIFVGYRYMHDDGFTVRKFAFRKIPEEVATVARHSWEHGWQQPAVRMLMLLSFLHMGFLIWGWYAWQPYFLALLERPDLVWVAGVIAALVSLLMIVGNQLVRNLQGRIRRPMLLVLGSAGLALCMIAVGLAETVDAALGLGIPFYLAVGTFLLGMVAFGLVGPVKQAALHRLIPSEQRATIVSFDGLLGSAGGVGSQLGLAKIADARGFAAGYLVGGTVLLLGVPIALRFRSLHPAIGDPPEPSRPGENG